MILVVDDMRTFGFNATYARTSKEGLAQLHGEWKVIWLDHDLGGDDTTMPVVDELCRMAFEGTPHQAEIVVHTSNPVGESMSKVLRRYGYYVRRVDAAQFM